MFPPYRTEGSPQAPPPIGVHRHKQQHLPCLSKLDSKFFEIGWQRATEPKVGRRDAKNFWSSLSKQTRGKSKNLKCNNGVRHEKHEDVADL
jgi:hypothetical protein